MSFSLLNQSPNFSWTRKRFRLSITCPTWERHGASLWLAYSQWTSMRCVFSRGEIRPWKCVCMSCIVVRKLEESSHFLAERSGNLANSIFDHTNRFWRTTDLAAIGRHIKMGNKYGLKWVRDRERLRWTEGRMEKSGKDRRCNWYSMFRILMKEICKKCLWVDWSALPNGSRVAK